MLCFEFVDLMRAYTWFSTFCRSISFSRSQTPRCSITFILWKLKSGLRHLNWKFNVFVHRKTTFTLLLLWRVIWAARYFWWPLLIGPIKNWDPLPIPFHLVPIILGPTFNGIRKNRCLIDRHRCDPMPIFGRVPLPVHHCWLESKV